MFGNIVGQRFRLNNLVIANIPTVENLAVDVAVTAGKVKAGSVGFAVPVGATMTNGIPGIVPVEATTNANLRLTFTNASAGAINPADTFDFEVFLFDRSGVVAQTV